MRSKSIIAILVLASSVTARADESVTIKKLALKQQRIVVSTVSALPEGRMLKIKDVDCQMAVTKSNAHVAVLNVADCGQASEFQVGQVLAIEPAIPAEGGSVADESAGGESHHSKRSITDLEFVPYKKKFFMRGSYERTTMNNTVSQSGVGYSSTARTQSLLTGTLYYGISDRFAMGLSLGYVMSDPAATTYGDASTISGVSQTAPSSGMTDPNILGVYRVFDQGTDSFNLDVTFSYSPKLVTATYASSTATGNEGRGGDSKAVGAIFTKKGTSLAYGARLNYLSNGAATGTDATSGTVVNVGTLTQISLAGMLQYQVTNSLFIPFIFTDTMFSTQTSDAVATSSYSQMSWNLGAVYELLPKKMTVYFRYISYLAVSETAVQGGTSLAEVIANGPNTTLRLGLTYLF